MKKIITYGTFDVFHVGHLRLLQRLRDLGQHLTVGVSTDEFNALKGKQSSIRYEDRCEIIRGLKCVDDVIPEYAWSQKKGDILRLNIQVFGMGDDWIGGFDELKSVCEVIYLPRTPDVSSTSIKQGIGMFVRTSLSSELNQSKSNFGA